MACIYTKGNKIYISWYDATTGKRCNKSTGLSASSVNMRKAKSIAKLMQQKLDEERDKLKSLNIHKVTIEYAFQHFLKINSDKHPKTVKDYLRFYNKLIEYFPESEHCTVLTKLSVEDWLSEIKTLPLQPNSIFGYYKQLNHFLNFLFEYNYLPMFKINKSIKPKPQIKEKIVFTDENIIKIYNGLESKNPNFITAINLLYYTGLRSSDILTITCDRIDLNKREFTYYSPKRKKYRTVGFHEDLVPVFKNRIQEVKVGELLEYRTVENLGRAVTSYFKQLKINDHGYTARTFRKSFITNLRSLGIDSSIVAELVGHEHKSTADRFYNNITTDLMKEELKKFKRPTQ